MENIHFSNIRSASKYLCKYGEEIYNDIYKMSDGNLIKKYDKKKSLDRDDDFCEKNLLNFKDIEIFGVSFTRALVYCGISKIFATITEYVPGESIDNRPLSSYQIDELINAISRFMITIKKLSDLGICIIDAYRGNIVYDGKNLTLIDTTEYRYKKENISSLYRDNMISVMKEIFFSIFCDAMVFEHFNFTSYFDNFNSDKYLMHPCQTLVNIRNFMEEYFGVKLNTFDDCRLLLQKKICNKVISRRR